MTADAERLTAIREKLQPHFADIAYLCTRSWGAWQYGTMTEDDFIAADQDDEFMLNLAETVAKLVAAEKERADRAEALFKDAASREVSAYRTSHALRARIEAVKAIVNRDLAGSVARSLNAALAEDQPEAVQS